MRIISGTFGGRVFNPPRGLPVRPTTDFAKTALFNLLNSRLDWEETTVLDLCCGTGSISLECASRGVKKITAVDTHANCLKFISDTAKTLGISNLQTFKADIFKFIEKETTQYDFIFVDPPYESNWISQISEVIFKQNILAKNGILIIEHGGKTKLSTDKNFIEQRKYGNVNFSIFKHHEISL